ncbi:MAG: hypothetical protein IBJ09_12100 [Bacteroidia bacterium]|nr:hypothetical protein [Bacteroidia bacterium]
MSRLFYALTVTVLFLCHSFTGRAQYLLTAISPPPQFTHDDLWNLTLTRTNTSDNYTQFYIALRIFNNNSLLEVKTNSAMLPLSNAVTVIHIGNIADVQPFTINYYNATVLQQVVASGGLFPPGVWNIDFTLYGRPSDGEFTELADYSYPLIVDAMWPPMLLSPADGDTVQTLNPILTWTPAFSTYLPGNVMYNLRVVPIFTGQTKQQAITANYPAYQDAGIPMPLQIYPNTAQPLDSNTRYAWQAEGFSGSSSLGQSEVWEFCYCFGNVIDSVNVPLIWYDLQPDNTDNIYLFNSDSLRFRFTDPYLISDSSFLQFELIREETGEIITDNNTCGDGPFPSSRIHYAMDLDGLQLHKGTYRLVISDTKRQKYVMRFIYAY